MAGDRTHPSLTVTPEIVQLLARAAGLHLTLDRARLLAPSVQALLAGDARLADLMYPTGAAGPAWLDVTDA